jgi:hypothetical protein
MISDQRTLRILTLNSNISESQKSNPESVSHMHVHVLLSMNTEDAKKGGSKKLDQLVMILVINN